MPTNELFEELLDDKDADFEGDNEYFIDDDDEITV
jgi:hypothetical protein